MSRAGNRNRAKFTFKFSEHDSENKLDVLDEFIDWTKAKHLKSYIEIAEMLDITPNEAKKYLDLAKMPEYDSEVLKRMKEVLAQNRFHGL